jgi:hypothetical protein
MGLSGAQQAQNPAGAAAARGARSAPPRRQQSGPLGAGAMPGPYGDTAAAGYQQSMPVSCFVVKAVLGSMLVDSSSCG